MNSKETELKKISNIYYEEEQGIDQRPLLVDQI